MANALVALALRHVSSGARRVRRPTYNDTVVPRKYSELVQSSNEIPTRSNITGNENANGQGGESVHAGEFGDAGREPGEGAVEQRRRIPLPARMGEE